MAFGSFPEFDTLLSCTLQKNSHGALMVLKQMEESNVKPDSRTLSYLINNCESEEDINKVDILSFVGKLN